MFITVTGYPTYRISKTEYPVSFQILTFVSGQVDPLASIVMSSLQNFGLVIFQFKILNIFGRQGYITYFKNILDFRTDKVLCVSLKRPISWRLTIG